MSEQETQRIYLDHQATTPVDERVMEAMQPYFTEAYGNAASNDHLYGVDANQAVDEARNTTADAIGAKSDEVIFTSGATESDNIAVFGVAERYEDGGKHVITCKTGHKAVLDPCEQLEERGWEVTYLPVDEYGMVDPDDVRDAIREDTTLISIMMANNEVGTIASTAASASALAGRMKTSRPKKPHNGLPTQWSSCGRLRSDNPIIRRAHVVLAERDGHPRRKERAPPAPARGSRDGRD